MKNSQGNEVKTRELYRMVRYSPNRPVKWNLSNRSRGFFIQSIMVNHYAVEKLLLAVLKSKITRINVNNIDNHLVFTSSQAPFEYKLKPWVKKNVSKN